MSIAYPAVKDQIIYHSLAHPFGGVVEINNTCQFYVYVSIGPSASVADILSQNVALVAPYGRRAFKVNITNQSPVISIVPTDKPYQFTGTIRDSQALIRITEFSDPKAFLNSPTFEGLAADYLIIANGLIEANQEGIYARDSAGNEVLAVNIVDGKAWAGRTLDDGDLMIGRGGQYLLWDNSAGTFTIVSSENLRAVSSDVSFGASGEVVYYSSGDVRLSDGRSLGVTGGSYDPAGSGGVSYLTVDPAATVDQSLGVFYWDDIPADVLVVAVVVSNGTGAPSVFANYGGTMISGGQIVTGSIVTGNLAATAIDGMIITGATIRTNAATVPDVQMDSDGISILSDAADRVQWVDSSGARVASQSADYSTTYNLFKLYANELLNRARGVVTVAAASSSGSVGKVSLDLSNSASNDKAELSHSSPGGNLVAVRILRTIIEMCAGASGSLIQGIVFGGRGGVSPRGGAFADFIGTVVSNGFIGSLTGNVAGDLTGNVAGNVTGSLTGNVAGNLTGDVNGGTVNADQVNCDQIMVGSYGSQGPGEINAEGRIATKEFFYAAGSPGITATVALAKLTSGGANGALYITGGIITGKVDPT